MDRKEVCLFFWEFEDKGYFVYNKVVLVLKVVCNYVIDFEDVGLIFNLFECIKKMLGVMRSWYFIY